MSDDQTTRVLLVDDHQMMREGLRAVLDNHGAFSVVGQASSGREAIRLARLLAPDVVVMDVAMSDLNGIEATRHILTSTPGSIVVALSSHSDRRYVKAILEAGASGYVLKSCAFQHLVQALDAARKGRRYLCAEIASEIVGSALRQNEPGSVHDILGPREREVLQLLVEGLGSSEIAERLSVSTSTIETHRRDIMRKLDAHDVAELTKYAIRDGLTSLEQRDRRHP